MMPPRKRVCFKTVASGAAQSGDAVRVRGGVNLAKAKRKPNAYVGQQLARLMPDCARLRLLWRRNRIKISQIETISKHKCV
jgi:hypothetical protein